MTGQRAGELREQPVAESPADRRLGLRGTRADHQVVCPEACDQPRREGRKERDQLLVLLGTDYARNNYREALGR